MKYFIPLLIVLLCVGCSNDHRGADADSIMVDSSVADSTVRDTIAPGSSIGGVYAFGGEVDGDARGMVMIYPESDSTFLFRIDFNRGAPSYNMGLLAQRGKIVGDTGIYYREEPDAAEACEIRFYFRKDFVQLVTQQGECGFGANVMVDHVYDRLESTVPQFYTGPEGDTVYFSNLSKALR
jgi:hypothetical protein